MIAFLARRGIRLLLTVWLALTIVFVALRALPGDAISVQLSQSGATAAQIAARQTALGLDQPLSMQYAALWADLLHGSLGRSLLSMRPVSAILAEQWGATVQLATAAAIVAVLVGSGAGLLAGLAPRRIIRVLAMAFIALIAASPVYWTGTLAIWIFGVWLKVLPSAGSSGWQQLVLPAATLGLAAAGAIGQVTATTVRAQRQADYVRTARAKGLRPGRILYAHLLRPVMTPILTVIGLQFGFLLGGAAITEALFVRQGLGQILLNAINTRDYPVVQGVVMLAAILFSVVNSSVDIVASLLDPRLAITPDAR